MKKFCNSKFLIHVVCSFGLLACSPEKSKDTPSGDQQIAHGGGDNTKTKDTAKDAIFDGHKKKIDVLQSQIAQQKETIVNLQNGTNAQKISQLEAQVKALETDKATLKREKDDLENEKKEEKARNERHAKIQKFSFDNCLAKAGEMECKWWGDDNGLVVNIIGFIKKNPCYFNSPATSFVLRDDLVGPY